MISIVGTRPQFIKAAILSKVLDMDIIDTGQHYDHSLAGQYFEEFDIKPIRLVSSGDVASMYKNLCMSLHKYKTVLVYGDCNTTLAGALAAKRLNKRLVHIEAGCRSFNRRMVEESIRITTDHLADLNLSPTKSAVNNLKNEGIDGIFVGDLSQDYIYNLERKCTTSPIIATIHRAENIENMPKILEMLEAVDLPILWPQHPKMEVYKLPTNVISSKPLEYSDMLNMIDAAPLVITDSGGLQKEAYMLKTKCVTLRNDTEWPETLEGGWNTLVGTDMELFLQAVGSIPDEWQFGHYGDGHAAERIKNELERLD